MRLSLVTLLVPDYDEAIAFYCGAMGFALLEDTDMGAGKRWVRAGPPESGCAFLLAKAVTPAQRAAIGNQAGGRVGFFITSDDFDADHRRMVANGVRFREAPRRESYGTVAVFEDPWGNAFDLIQLTNQTLGTS